jgi:hypothetical protein
MIKTSKASKSEAVSAPAPALGPELELAHGLTNNQWKFHRRS